MGNHANTGDTPQWTGSKGRSVHMWHVACAISALNLLDYASAGVRTRRSEQSRVVQVPEKPLLAAGKTGSNGHMAVTWCAMRLHSEDCMYSYVRTRTSDCIPVQ